MTIDRLARDVDVSSNNHLESIVLQCADLSLQQSMDLEFPLMARPHGLASHRVFIRVVGPVDHIDVKDRQLRHVEPSLRLDDRKPALGVPIDSSHLGDVRVSEVFPHDAADAVDFAPEARGVVFVMREAEVADVVRVGLRLRWRALDGAGEGILGWGVGGADFDFLEEEEGRKIVSAEEVSEGRLLGSGLRDVGGAGV